MNITEYVRVCARKTDRMRRSANILWFMLLSNLLHKPIPVFMYIHLTNRCNLRCKYCYANASGRFDKSGSKDFSTETWKKLIDDSICLGARYFHFYGGEPLVRDDIGEIIDFTKRKGAFVEVMTNGHLVRSKINEIKGMDSVCLSLDGNEEVNDGLRGKGNFNMVKDAVLVCKENDIPVRIHAVIHKFNIERPEYLPQLAKEWGVTVSYSQPHIFDYIDKANIALTDAEIRNFWIKIKELKKSGYPIDNTSPALDYVISWPISYQYIVKSKEESESLHREKRFKFLNCKMGKMAVVIDSEGSLLPCLNFGMFSDIKFNTVGFKEAYKILSSRVCSSCANLQFVEVNLAARLNIHSVIKGACHHI